MRKYLTTILLLTLMVSGANAQPRLDWGKINIDRPLMEQYGEQMIVSFSVSVAPKTVKNKHIYLLTPVLTDGRNNLSLPPVVVEGKNAWASQGRSQWLSGKLNNSQGALWMENGGTARYEASVPLQSWMAGANLNLEGLSANRRGSVDAAGRLLASGIQQWTQPVSNPASWSEPFALYKFLPPPPTQGPQSEGDQLAEHFPFVAHAPQSGEYDNPFELYEDQRGNTLIIYYHTGRHNIVPEYKDNEKLLEDLTSIIKRLVSAGDSGIERIDVAGFASPEGDPAANERLAYNRAQSIKEHILKTTDLPYYRILVYNGSIDWSGLRKLVAQSDMPKKEEVLTIIDDRENPETRLARLKQLGSTYNRMLREYFPSLRTGTMIRLYYKNADPEDAKRSFYRP